jgi:hypothetical protein
MGKLRAHARREDGQTLILFALAMPLFIALIALVLDGSNLFVQRRAMQNAADAAALAAANDVGPALIDTTCTSGSPCFNGVATNVGADATSYSQKNGGPSLHACANSGDTNCYTWPYPSDGGPGSASRGKVEVRLRSSVNGFFAAAALGRSLFNVEARSVANATGSLHKYCLDANGNPDPTLDPNANPPCFKAGNPGTNAFAFAHSTACNAIQLSNNEENYNDGALWSNGGISTNNLTGGTKNYTKRYFFGNTTCGVTPNSQPNFIDCGASNPPCSWPGGTWVNVTYHTAVPAGTWPLALPSVPGICPNGTYVPATNINSTWLSTHRGDISGTDMATTNGSTTVTAASGGFVANDAGRKINIGGTVYQIATVVNATTIRLTTAYTGATATNVVWYSAGVYCFTGSLNLQASFTGYMIVVTGTTQGNSINDSTGGLTLNGSALMAKVMNLANPNTKPMLYTTDGGINYSQAAAINGDMWAPNGLINLTGGGTTTGFLESNTIKVTQSGTRFIGDGPAPDASPDVHGTLKIDVVGVDLNLDE